MTAGRRASSLAAAGRPARRLFVRLLLALGVTGAAASLWIYLAPLPPNLLDRSRFAHTTVVDRNGFVLYESLPASGARGEWIAADAIPKHVVDATLAAEDRRFFSHHGVDPVAIARAAVQNVKALRVVEGGSTITQQVAKLLLQSSDRGIRSKAREAVVAVRLERRLGKGDILALYLNLAPYGNRIQGLARASRAYFGCEPALLTPAQAAFLAALPQRPGAFNPLRDPLAARKRQRSILARMHEAGRLPDADLEHARAEKLTFEKASHPALAMHFVERAIAASPGRTRIATTLDAALQRDVAGIVAAQREKLLQHGASSVAVAVLDNRTGEWLAWEGSGDYFGTSFGGSIDGVAALRQPGSTLKPFTYALAFERGQTPATVLADVSSSFATAEEGVVYTPRNYDGVHRGPMRVRAALAGSQNVPAVAMLSKLGAPSLLRLLRVSGFSSLDRTADYYGLGLTLGGGEVTLEQLVTAYATFARGGEAIQPTSLRGPGVTAWRRGASQPRGRHLFSPRTAFWISDILADDEARAYAFGRGGSLEFPFTVAVKTGTSQSYRDNWTIGYTRDVTVGVWVGNFDRRELRGSSGVTGAAPVFHSVMLAAVKRVRGELPIGEYEPIAAVPGDLASTSVCATSGMRPSPWCTMTEVEWLPRTEPVRICSWHREGSTAWPAEYRAWARENAPGTIAPAPAAPSNRVARALEIANPPDGATYLIDPTLRREFQTLRLSAAADRPVTWRIGSHAVGTAAPGERVEWPLEPGRHVVTATDTAGNRDSVTITVR